MPEYLLSVLFKYYRQPVGHRLYAMRKTKEMVQREPQLLALVEACLAHDTALLEKRTRFVELRGAKPNWPPRAIELDQEHDRLLSGAEKVVLGMESGPAGAPTTLAATRLRGSLFAGGLVSLTQLDFVQQREQTQTWLTRLARESKEDIEVLGLKAIFDRLGVVTTEFGELIDQNKPEASVTYEQLRDGEAQGHELMLRYVVAACARYNSGSPEDNAARTRVLAPIMERNEVVGELYRKRAVTDVNPDTGEVVQPAVQPVGPVSPIGEAPIGGASSPFVNR